MEGFVEISSSDSPPHIQNIYVFLDFRVSSLTLSSLTHSVLDHCSFECNKWIVSQLVVLLCVKLRYIYDERQNLWWFLLVLRSAEPRGSSWMSVTNVHTLTVIVRLCLCPETTHFVPNSFVLWERDVLEEVTVDWGFLLSSLIINNE